MEWIRAKIYTTTQGIEPLCGMLYDVGVAGVEIDDSADFEDFLQNQTQYWDYVDEDLMSRRFSETCVQAYVNNNDMLVALREGLARLAERQDAAEWGRLELVLDSVSEQDWATNWQQYYKPINVGERVLICPEWERADNPEGRVLFRINPGMSFGTGTHESTQLCIELIEKHLRRGDAVLDVGCGSGILSIIALLLGAERAVAVDIDPNAARIAAQNAALNHISVESYITMCGNFLSDAPLRERIGRFDIYLANIVADVIIPLAHVAAQNLKPGGLFIASGIINDRLEEVKEHMPRNGFSVVETVQKGDWAAFAAIHE